MPARTNSTNQPPGQRDKREKGANSEKKTQQQITLRQDPIQRSQRLCSSQCGCYKHLVFRGGNGGSHATPKKQYYAKIRVYCGLEAGFLQAARPQSLYPHEPSFPWRKEATEESHRAATDLLWFLMSLVSVSETYTTCPVPRKESLGDCGEVSVLLINRYSSWVK